MTYKQVLAQLLNFRDAHFIHFVLWYFKVANAAIINIKTAIDHIQHIKMRLWQYPSAYIWKDLTSRPLREANLTDNNVAQVVV